MQVPDKLNSKINTTLWLAMVLAPLISILIMAVVSGSDLASFDAYNSSANDERGYYWAVTQMREFGHPSGQWGYNETTAECPSYGVYGIFVHIPYYLASFITGYDSHNFMYIINMLFGVVSAAVAALILRSNVKQAICFIALFLFHFIITSYLFRVCRREATSSTRQYSQAACFILQRKAIEMIEAQKRRPSSVS